MRTEIVFFYLCVFWQLALACAIDEKKMTIWLNFQFGFFFFFFLFLHLHSRSTPSPCRRRFRCPDLNLKHALCSLLLTSEFPWDGSRNPANDSVSCLCGSRVCGWMMLEIRIGKIGKFKWRIHFSWSTQRVSVMLSQQIPRMHFICEKCGKTVSYRQPDCASREKSVFVLKQMSLESHRKYFYSPQFFMAGTAVTVYRSMRSPSSEENFPYFIAS